MHPAWPALVGEGGAVYVCVLCNPSHGGGQWKEILEIFLNVYLF